MTQRHWSRLAPRRLPLGRLVFGISLLLPLLPAAVTAAAEVEVPRAFDAIGVGSSTSCAIDADGDLRCWGDGSMGALGTGSTGNVGSGSGTAMADLEPVVIPAMDPAARFVAVDGGVQFTCALDDLGSVWCWGRNEASQLGLDSDAIWVHPDSIVAPVDLGATAESISVGPYHSCAVLTGGSVRCWGFDRSGSLGVGLPGQQVGSTAQPVSSVDPVDLGSGRVAVGVSAGGQHTCVLLDDASMLCWGENDFGQLGAGDVVDRGRTLDSMGDALVPVDLPGAVVSMAAGGEHTCAVLDDASLHCWGLNASGQLGLGDTTNRGGALREVGSITEVDFGGTGVVSVEAGSAMTCALLEDGSAACWGRNAVGELGRGDL
ncbi:MAG: RCC1 domain-containing protein, partial [Ilumatobacteraceae bacterium]